MADVEADVDVDLDDVEAVKKEGEAPGVAPKKKHEDVETQNLENVTDFVEETENSEELGKVWL